jgi:outer membrane receptor for ferrienterochelin and colicins
VKNYVLIIALSSILLQGFSQVEDSPSDDNLSEIVISATMKPVSRLDCTVPVEVYHSSYFLKNPTPSIFDALQNVNGVRPQVNCNICNTGDIHINGLEGPYTMILIDGMPIVGSLSSVYGLSGIPNSLIDRVEIVKGPASALYGSEAVGGLINVITKKVENAPKWSVDFSTTTWSEFSFDMGNVSRLGKNVSVLTGASAFLYDNPIDVNGDNFTDVTLQKRFSIFQKYNFKRKSSKLLQFASRYNFEDRWGGEMNWTDEFRGGDSIYGESIYTRRFELIGLYELPTVEKLMLSVSMSNHTQDSRYGRLAFDAIQQIYFAQLTWDKKLGKHDLLAGSAIRQTYYDDNTVATTEPSSIVLPGVFVQDELELNDSHKLLFGFRVDWSSSHGVIRTPRIGYKWKISPRSILRINGGTGFRNVNVFAEEHAALTGAREVIITEDLKPEQSKNINVNYIIKSSYEKSFRSTFDISLFYTYFSNQIIGDYDSDPDNIVFSNLKGYSLCRGMSVNWLGSVGSWDLSVGGTIQDISIHSTGLVERPILTERFMGTWGVSRSFFDKKWSVDYTGNVIGPMRLPVLGENDPRSPFSPWTSVQNLQLTYKNSSKMEFSISIKNLLNQLPWKNQPFLIARSNDPFDKQVEFDSAGNVLRTEGNPFGLTFDPTYVYMANQGFRAMCGIRWKL